MVFIWQHHVWYLGLRRAAPFNWSGGHAGIHFIYFRVALCMAATSVCSLLQNWDASHDAGIISCPSYSLKQLLYFTLCICQQRVFQVFFDIYLIFNIVHMNASCLLPVSATYRNAQLMDSLLSYFSSKRHAVFSETAKSVLCCHSTFFSCPDFHFNGSTLTWITRRGAALPPPPAPITSACTKPVITSPLSKRNPVLLFCICFNCLIKIFLYKKSEWNLIESVWLR